MQTEPFVILQGVIVNMNAHNIGTRQPTAAPQEETDTHMHNQPTPDVISTAPVTHPIPSSHHPTQAHHPVQLPEADSAYGVDPVSSTQQASNADFDPIADSFQEPASTSSPVADLVGLAKDLLPNSIAGAIPSTQEKQPPASSQTVQTTSHQQPAAGSSEAHDTTNAANQPGMQTNVDDRSQGSASQLQQAAEGAAQAQSQSSMPSPQQQQVQQPAESSQPPEVHASYQHKDFVPSMSSSQRLQVQEPAGSSQPSEVYASYQHKGFVPSTAHHQPQSHTAADHMQGQSQAAPSPHHASAPQPPHVQLEPSSQDRQAAFNQPEPSSSQSPAAQASAGLQQTAQPGVAFEAEDQATSQDTTSASTGGQDAVSGQLAQPQLGRPDQLTAAAAAGLTLGHGSDAKAGAHAAASDVQALEGRDQAEQEGTSGRGDNPFVLPVGECFGVSL